ncbi:hypothetical protein AOQ87_01710 [Candidatus Riesia pediculischaeffi]|uniref:hydroxyacylglutathione hydrolase n=2 Tax=Candidatus Riesia pediculischaeffi TaxID=428411 RepID=A0A1V0HKL4_9ENTR|nr:hypothetical protein AOQ87_01710 [Candidatus Riesia pediculischaeffi]KIE63857.1 Hydroxyacylglutathione hydrolase [Candidatus Riesia pediculischaeffi PTSU]
MPGHTSGHLLYYEKPYLFCGDTLFSGGCGKIFEGTTQQMFRSILLIKSFPQNTLICCAHEYTVKNLKFAKLLLPNDNHIKRYLDHSQKRVSKFLPTVPSTLEVEKKINIFLRCGDENIRRSLKKVGIEWRGIDSLKTGEHETFSILRKMRDRF